MGDMGTMGDKLATLTTVLYYLCWPFIALFRALRSILTPFWTIAQFILLPITYLAHTLFTIALFPFRMHLLDRFETIYIYLGIAALIGCVAGAMLHFSFSFLSSTLSIDAASEAKAVATGRTAAAYRAARRRRKAESLDEASNQTMENTVPASQRQRQRGLLSQTIIEEDSDF